VYIKNACNEKPYNQFLLTSRELIDGSDGIIYFSSVGEWVAKPSEFLRLTVDECRGKSSGRFSGFSVGFTCGSDKVQFHCEESPCRWYHGRLNPNEFYINERRVSESCENNRIEVGMYCEHCISTGVVTSIKSRPSASCALRDNEFLGVETLSGDVLLNLDYFDSTRYGISGWCPTLPFMFTKKVIIDEEEVLGVFTDTGLYERLNSGETIDLKEKGVETAVIYYKFLNLDKTTGEPLFGIPCDWNQEIWDINKKECISKSGIVLIAGSGSTVDVANSQIISTPDVFKGCPPESITERLENGTIRCVEYLPINKLCEGDLQQDPITGDYFCYAPVERDCPAGTTKIQVNAGVVKCIGKVQTKILGVDIYILAGIIGSFFLLSVVLILIVRFKK